MMTATRANNPAVVPLPVFALLPFSPSTSASTVVGADFFPPLFFIIDLNYAQRRPVLIFYRLKLNGSRPLKLAGGGSQMAPRLASLLLPSRPRAVKRDIGSRMDTGQFLVADGAFSARNFRVVMHSYIRCWMY